MDSAGIFGVFTSGAMTAEILATGVEPVAGA
jgi:hypothetical protein